MDLPPSPGCPSATLARTNPPLIKINMVNHRVSTAAAPAQQLRLRVCEIVVIMIPRSLLKHQDDAATVPTIFYYREERDGQRYDSKCIQGRYAKVNTRRDQIIISRSVPGVVIALENSESAADTAIIIVVATASSRLVSEF